MDIFILVKYMDTNIFRYLFVSFSWYIYIQIFVLTISIWMLLSHSILKKKYHSILCGWDRMAKWESWAASGVLGVSAAVLPITCQSSLIWRVTNNPPQSTPPFLPHPTTFIQGYPHRGVLMYKYIPPSPSLSAAAALSLITRGVTCVARGGIGVSMTHLL